MPIALSEVMRMKKMSKALFAALILMMLCSHAAAQSAVVDN